MAGPRRIGVPRLLHIWAGALDDLGASLSADFDRSTVVVVTGAERSRALGERLAASLEAGGSAVRVHPESEGTLEAGARLLEQLDHDPVTLMVAVGGGRPIDVAKLASTRAGVDLVAVPTVLSHDGMCSPVASLLASDGARRSIGVSMPAGVVIDTRVVAGAPLRYVRAGLGDLVSNITAVADWIAASSTTGEPVDHLAASIALVSAQSALDVSWPPTDDDLATIGRGLVMSGLAMEIAGSSRPCSGAEHLISHAVDELRDGASSALHGEQVGLGVLVAASLQEESELPRIAALFERIGLAEAWASAGLDRTLLAEAIRHAPSTRPERRTVLDRADLAPAAVDKLVDGVLGPRP